MKILMLAPFVPYPARFGGAMRIYQLIRQLARRHEVHLLAFGGPTCRGDPAGVRPFCRSLVEIPRDVSARRWRRALSLLFPRSFQSQFQHSHAMHSALLRIVREQGIELILVEFSQMACRRFPAGVPVVVDEHNIEFDLLARISRRREQFSPRKLFGMVEALKFHREELAAVRRAALTLVTSDRDGELLRQHAPGIRTATIVNGVDCDYFARPPAAPPPKPDTAVFVGAMHRFPNEHGVLFFLRDVLGLIQARRPRFTFNIVGEHASPAVQVYRSGNVRVLGAVEDVRPCLWEASVCVVPLRMGGGTRFKIIEAFAAGVPVVSTSYGAEGIPVTHERELLLADDPADFARAVERILADPALAAALAANGLAFVRRYFDWTVIGDKLHSVLSEVAAAPRIAGA